MANSIIAQVTGSKGDKYDIRWSEVANRLTCNCKDFEFRISKIKGENCKHIKTAIQLGVIPKHMENPVSRYKPVEDFKEVINLVDEKFNDAYDYRICGSFRRLKQKMKDLDYIVYIPDNEHLQMLQKDISEICDSGKTEYGGDLRITAIIKGVQIDFRIYSDLALEGSMLLHFTGSRDNNIRLRKRAIEMHMKLSEYGLIDNDGKGEIVASKTEEGIYNVLGLPFQKPEERS